MLRTNTRRGAMGTALAALVTLSIPAVATAAGDGAVIVDDGESIQAAIDASPPGTTIHVRGDHAEQVWINKDGIKLLGEGATLSMPDEPDFEAACGPTLICVISPTANFEDPFDPAGRLSDVEVSGFTASNPFFDTIGTYLVDGLTIERNVSTSSGCDAIFVLLATDFRVERNSAADAGCDVIHVVASIGGTVTRNTATGGAFAGFSIDDVSDVEVSRNTATDNCIGIVVFDSPGPLSSSGVSVTRNTANANNTVCYPFGPPPFGPPVGVAGILVAGVSDIVVARNTANDNVSTDPAGSIGAGGIVIDDWVDDLGVDSASDVLVDRNEATGNSTVLGEVDINVLSSSDSIVVSRNHCQYGAPDADWCPG